VPPLEKPWLETPPPLELPPDDDEVEEPPPPPLELAVDPGVAGSASRGLTRV
jgi:hypothetical protein